MVHRSSLEITSAVLPSWSCGFDSRHPLSAKSPVSLMFSAHAIWRTVAQPRANPARRPRPPRDSFGAIHRDIAGHGLAPQRRLPADSEGTAGSWITGQRHQPGKLVMRQQLTDDLVDTRNCNSPDRPIGSRPDRRAAGDRPSGFPRGNGGSRPLRQRVCHCARPRTR
jgi:hypothetical protein